MCSLHLSATANKFRVQVKEAESLSVPGLCDLSVGDDAISLHAIQSGESSVSGLGTLICKRC